jgi:hypothetical protein
MAIFFGSTEHIYWNYMTAALVTWLTSTNSLFIYLLFVDC